MVEDYNSLDLVRDGEVVHEFGLSSAAAGLSYFYWTWARLMGDFVVIGSPAQAWALTLRLIYVGSRRRFLSSVPELVAVRDLDAER
jgi:hypothetical protein